MRAQGRKCTAWWLVLVAGNLLLFGPKMIGQSLDFAPEFDIHVKLNKNTRFWFQAVRTREEGSPIQTEIGPSLEFSVKPLLKLRRWTERQPDRFKSRTLSINLGYRREEFADRPGEDRGILEASPRYPLAWKVFATDRNRGELRWAGGAFSWRYRNRLTLEREVPIRSYTVLPYLRGEGYFDSRYSKWSATAICGGLVFPMKKHAEIESNFEYMNQTGAKPNRQVGTFGLTLSLYF